MSTEINRRDFLTIIFASASAAAVSGGAALWPSSALTRPVSEPVILAVDEYNYLVDPNFCYCPSALPTFRELHSLEGLDRHALKTELDKNVWRIERLVSDPDSWSLDEITDWLDSQVELRDLSPWKAMSYTQYGRALKLYERLDHEVAKELELCLVEGPLPCSEFVGIAFYGDLDELNRGLARQGMNLVVSEG